MMKALAIPDIPEQYKPQIDALILKTKLPDDDVAVVKANFAKFFADLAPMEADALAIVVTNVDDTDGMKQAHDLRMKLVKLRTRTDKRRKEIKDTAKRQIDLIDGIGKLAKDSISALEDHLHAQEKYAEIQRQKVVDGLKAEREKTFADAGLDLPIGINLGLVESGSYEAILSDAKAAKLYREQQEREKAQEAERAAQRNQELENELIQKQLETKRIQIVTSLGLKWDGVGAYKDDFGQIVTESFLKTAGREDFNQQINLVKLVIESREPEPVVYFPHESTPIVEDETTPPWMRESASDVEKLRTFNDYLTGIEIPKVSDSEASIALTSLRYQITSTMQECAKVIERLENVEVAQTDPTLLPKDDPQYTPF